MQSGYREGVEAESAARDRNAEFVDADLSPSQLLELKEEGWAVFFGALGAFMPADLQQPLIVRGEEHTVLEALQRQAIHYSGHVYQIQYTAKALAGADWQSLTIPRGESAAYNAQRLAEERP